MRAFLRSLGSVVAGFVAASIIMMIVEAINGRLLHPELAKAAEGLKDPQALKALLATAPVSAFLVVLLGWILGGIAGGWLSARFAGRSPVSHGLALGALLTLAGISNNLMLPPPAWFWVASLLVLMPSAYAGARLASKA